MENRRNPIIELTEEATLLAGSCHATYGGVLYSEIFIKRIVTLTSHRRC